MMKYGTVDRDECLCCEPKNGPKIVTANVKAEELWEAVKAAEILITRLHELEEVWINLFHTKR